MPRQVIEIAFATAVFVLSALGLQQALGFSGRSSIMPVAVMGFAMVLCCVWCAQSIRSLIWQRENVHLTAAEVCRLLVIVVLSPIYVIAIGVLGFFTSSALFVPLAAVGLGLRQPIAIVLTTGLFMAVLYCVFGLLLKTPLPPGAIAHWFGTP